MRTVRSHSSSVALPGAEYPPVPSGLDYDDLVERGREVCQVGIACQWELGDLANTVETSYGDDSLADYADDLRHQCHDIGPVP